MVKTIGILGGGVMGSTILGVLKKTFSKSSFLVCDLDVKKGRALAKKYSVRSTTDSNELSNVDIVILAIKPQDFLATQLRFRPGVLVVSIMAGISIATISRHTGARKIIRAMPNTAARFGQGFTAWVSTSAVDFKEKKFCDKLFNAMGIALEVKTEQEINKVTAITGSGPAYIIHTLLCFVMATQQLGFDSKTAQLMVRQTAVGVMALLEHESDLDLLIAQVASKGGTTEAALKVFNDARLDRIWQKAIKVAFNRATELGKNSHRIPR